MSRLESNEFPIESTGSFTENRFDLHNTDTAAGPQRPFELRRESLAEFDSEFRVAETIHSSGKSPEVVQALANADRLFAEREYRIAEGLYRSVLRLHSDDEQVIRGLAKCLRAQDRHEEAVKVLRQLVRQHNSAANFFLLAEELYVMNYNEDALDTYFNVLRFGTSEPTVLFQTYKNIGNLLLRLGDPDGAEEYYNKAFTLDPDSDVLLVNFGSLAMFRGDLDRALSRFREAVQLNDRNDKAWVGLAMIHREYGDSELAWANVEKALDIDPGNESAIKLVTDWATKDNEIEKAVSRIEGYLSVHPHDAFMAMMLAKFLYFAGFMNDALLEIEKALDLDPNLQEGNEIRDIIRAEMRARETLSK